MQLHAPDDDVNDDATFPWRPLCELAIMIVLDSPLHLTLDLLAAALDHLAQITDG